MFRQQRFLYPPLLGDSPRKNGATPGSCATATFLTTTGVWKLNSSSRHTNSNPPQLALQECKTSTKYCSELLTLPSAARGCSNYANYPTSRLFLIFFFFALNNVKRGQHVFQPCRNLQQLLFACSNDKAHTDIIAVPKTTFYHSKYVHWLHKNTAMAKLWLTWWVHWRRSRCITQ